MITSLILAFICGTLGVVLGSALLWPRRNDEKRCEAMLTMLPPTQRTLVCSFEDGHPGPHGWDREL